MKIAILGAGIVGLTTAYQLTRDGHEVIVVDRQADVSLECSYANGGFIAISQAVPWSSPGVLLRVLTTMFRSDAPILLHPLQLPKIWRWGIEFLSCSSAPISWENTKHILSLALYSLDLLRKVRGGVGRQITRRRQFVVGNERTAFVCENPELVFSIPSPFCLDCNRAMYQ